ncbi:hypothetical protein K3495_g231 [Podosphaera aphanis]|nr:hypothetical protein K3495_g231 [Podosphaera aphanis]
MKWSLAAWKEILTQMISNCFKHTGLFEESIPNHTVHTLEADEQSIELGLHKALDRLAVPNAMSIANFLNPIEEDQGAVKELDDNQIIGIVQLPEEEECKNNLFLPISSIRINLVSVLKHILVVCFSRFGISSVSEHYKF